MPEEAPELFGKLRPFFGAFRSESDRACAVLARSLLENQLRDLLSATLSEATPKADRELFEGTGPLATFSARIRIAERLGLITKDESHDLNLVRKVANEFAHGLDHEMSFETESIRSRILECRFVNILLDHAEDWAGLLEQDTPGAIASSPRKRFELTVAFLALFIVHRSGQGTHAQAPRSLLVGI